MSSEQFHRANAPATLPHGSWPTPITSAAVVGSARLPGEAVRSGGRLWWSESRPDERGRTVIRCRPDAVDPAVAEGIEVGETIDVVGPEANVRTAVHEYGGGAWWVADETVWYCEWADQRIYRVDIDASAEPITPAPPVERSWRYADGDVSPDGSTILCVREDHSAAGEAVNTIVALDADRTSMPRIVVDGADFVVAPRWSPFGSAFSWIEWDHPNMPWDETRLVVDRNGERTVVAGGSERESVCQADWAADGTLWFSSDRSGFWSLYRWDPTSGETETMVDLGKDIGFPAWNLGDRCFVELDDGTVVFWYSDGGVHRIGARRPDASIVEFDTDFTHVAAINADRDGVLLTVASPTERAHVVRLVPTADTVPDLRVEVAAPDHGIASDRFAAPESISFPTAGGATAHALYYPPHNPDAVGPDGERPPLLVMIHGGPTSAARAMLSLSTQFWTSRGFAVVDVNYRGSTGYGREFRDLLRGNWGVADVEDCVAVAGFLAERGDVDGDRLLIRGGSAGGFTTLAALAFHDTFAAGASQFGVADLAALAADTHKFEARYLDLLVGPWPEASAVYAERSPINHIDGFDRPLVVFQGTDDEVVPPNQSEMIVEALRAKGVPVAYRLFEGEGHGFRQSTTQRAVLDGELSFYSQVLRFDLPAGEDVALIPVENL